ncbi:MAG TPA: hypothetical protein VGO49_03820 [Bradyrhizobium sp.]|jgi:hypothetical protein|nr:hypothetical protein [Bradyrhizobium sp.]
MRHDHGGTQNLSELTTPVPHVAALMPATLAEACIVHASMADGQSYQNIVRVVVPVATAPISALRGSHHRTNALAAVAFCRPAYYHSVMAEALQKAMETFAAAPRSPPDAAPVVPGHQQRENLLRSVKRFEDSVARWRADMLIVQQGLARMYGDLSGLMASNATNDELARLDEFIEHVDHEIESERLALEQSRFSNRQVIATMTKAWSDNAHFAKKILKRLYEAAVAQHNARVDFYHFLLAQRAEHNPDYSGGPTFDNAGELIADLHKHAR